MCFAFSFKISIYGIGFAIQYAVIIILWILCIINNIRYLSVIEIVFYCSIDLIISLAIPIFMFVLFSNDKVYDSYVYWLLGFAVLVICSKVAFFKSYKKRFSSQEEHPNIKKDVIAASDNFMP